MDSTERSTGIDGTEADVADVIEQAEPPAAEPVDEALGQRDPLPAGDIDDTRANPADALEQAAPVVAAGDEDLDDVEANPADVAEQRAETGTP